MIASSALPVGVDCRRSRMLPSYNCRKAIWFMVSDGVLDSFYERNIESDSQRRWRHSLTGFTAKMRMTWQTRF